jgi:uncharacterized membrane protein YfcA
VSTSPDLWVYAVSLLAVGIASGFATGLFGIGGGLIRIPVLLLLFPLFGISRAVVMHLAAGTPLALAIPSAAMACWAQRRAGNLDAALLRSWLPWVGLGVIVGLLLSRLASGRTIQAFFALVVALVALEMLFLSDAFRLRDGLPGPAARGLLGAVIGGISSILGLAGGTFVTPTLSLCGYPIHRAIAVGTAVGALVSSVGTIGLVVNGVGVPERPSPSLGYVDLVAFAMMLPTALLTSPLGVRVATASTSGSSRRSSAPSCWSSQ